MKNKITTKERKSGRERERWIEKETKGQRERQRQR
jgi:hypothetical protein